MTWDQPIAANGAIATPEQITAAWGCWLRSGDMTASALVACLIKEGVAAKAGRPPYRLADGMLQRARKAGAIRFVKGRWEIVNHG